jgi:hypothetical protein
MLEARDAYYFGWNEPTVRQVRELAETLDGTGGYVTGAPPHLADIYADILAAHGTDPYFYPRRERGAPAVGFEPNHQARVLLVGRQYLIGSGFSAERVPFEILGTP